MTSEATKTTEKVETKAKEQPKKLYGRGKARVQKGLVYAAAVITFAVLLFLIAYILINGIPNLKLSLFEWTYNSDNVSMMPAIITTVEMTLLALIIAVPLGLFTAIYLNEYAKRGNKLVNLIRITTETLSGIPSIVYGLFGMLFFVTQLHWGYSLIAGGMTLAIMILPTIIGPTESALRSVPESYYEGSLALGATKERSIFFVILPAAKSGILAAVVLGIGRAIGETMAVIMVAGNQARMPQGLLKGLRTLTANIVTEMGYATGLHREALIATGVVLFVFILIINLCLSLLNRRAENAD